MKRFVALLLLAAASCYAQTAWTPVAGGGGGGGSGTVTSFSAGNLVPIFTTGVATATVTPALSFTLSTAGAHTFLGNNTGSTAPPSYVQPAFSDLAGNIAVSQMNSGTGATSSTFWRGDGTWAAAGGATTHTVTFTVDGSGAVLTAGTKGYVKIPYGGTLQGWTLIGSPSGSVTCDIFRAADGGGLPVTSIVGPGTKPALATAVEGSSTTFTSWTSTTLTAKDNMAVSLSGVTNTTYVCLTLYFQ